MTPENRNMTPCRTCRRDVSLQALACPHCGAPFPAKNSWDGFGFEYKSKASVFGIPWIHIAFKFTSQLKPVPAIGIISIGQFGLGVINISQFGFGIISVSQFTIGVYAIAQFALAYSLIAQFGIYVDKGYGQFVESLSKLIGLI